MKVYLNMWGGSPYNIKDHSQSNYYRRHPYARRDDIFCECFRCSKPLTIKEIMSNSRFCPDCVKVMVSKLQEQINLIVRRKIDEKHI